MSTLISNIWQITSAIQSQQLAQLRPIRITSCRTISTANQSICPTLHHRQGPSRADSSMAQLSRRSSLDSSSASLSWGRFRRLLSEIHSLTVRKSSLKSHALSRVNPNVQKPSKINRQTAQAPLPLRRKNLCGSATVSTFSALRRICESSREVQVAFLAKRPFLLK